METPFLEKLLAFYDEDPEDPFNLYALALEYQKYDASKAAGIYKELLNKHSDYLPTYYHAAQFFIGAGENDEAEATFKRGIALAIHQNNNKAQTELNRAYRSFEDDQMDW